MTKLLEVPKTPLFELAEILDCEEECKNENKTEIKENEKK